MNREHEIEPGLREIDEIAQKAARLDAATAPERADRASGVTLEDRIFSGTKDVLHGTSPVVARIGPGGITRSGTFWKIAAAVALVTGVGALVLSGRPAATPTVIANNDSGDKSASDVELVLAVVSLLEEPLSGNFDQLVEDTARLHELVATDRSFSPETWDDRSTKQGV